MDRLELNGRQSGEIFQVWPCYLGKLAPRKPFHFVGATFWGMIFSASQKLSAVKLTDDVKQRKQRSRLNRTLKTKCVKQRESSQVLTPRQTHAVVLTCKEVHRHNCNVVFTKTSEIFTRMIILNKLMTRRIYQVYASSVDDYRKKESKREKLTRLKFRK